MATTIFEMGFNKQETASDLEILVYANLYSPDDIQFTGYIVVNGTTVQTCTANVILDNSSSRGQLPLSPFAFLRNYPAGPLNIQFIMENQETDNVTLTVKAGATMKISELKQGAR